MGSDPDRNQHVVIVEVIVEQATQCLRGRRNHPGMDFSERADAARPLPLDAATEARCIVRTH